MKKKTLYGLMVRLTICLLALSYLLYCYIDEQNHLTELKREIPQVEREVKRVLEESVRLQFAIDQFENPRHLMELAKRAEYRHLRYPKKDEILYRNERGNDEAREKGK